MATSYNRGHPVYWDGKIWRYISDNIPISEEERPCLKCKELPTTEGHDACLGYISNIKNACCGHGIKTGYIQYKNGRCIQLPKRG